MNIPGFVLAYLYTNGNQKSFCQIKEMDLKTEKICLIFPSSVSLHPHFECFFSFSVSTCDSTLSFFLLKYSLVSLHISSKCNSLLFSLMLFDSYFPFLVLALQFP